GVAELMSALRPLGLSRISYYKDRRRVDVDIDTLLPIGTTVTLNQGAART
ncbi:MAG TPA: histidinol phosphate phosphatase, partial [Pseudomonas sp.]|nr:histidinol phosphate phosphatase [Pseudomonas sp.]